MAKKNLQIPVHCESCTNADHLRFLAGEAKPLEGCRYADQTPDLIPEKSDVKPVAQTGETA